MRKLSANYIFPVISPPIKLGILIVNSNNIITEIIDSGENLREQANLEFYNGILVPGFIDDTEPMSFSNDALIKFNNQILETIFQKLNESFLTTFEKLLYEYTLKKAISLKCDDKFGSFEAGKSPGINLIYPFDFLNMTLTKESNLKRLV